MTESNWSVETDEISIKERMKAQNIQGIVIQDMIAERKKKEEAVEMTPQALLRHILTTLKEQRIAKAKEKEGGEMPVPILKDVHYYYAIKQTKDNFKLKPKNMIKLIGEVLIVDENMEEMLEYNAGVLCHFAKKEDKKKKLLDYFRSCITGKCEEQFLKRGSVLMYKMYKAGIVDQKIALDWYKELSAKKSKKGFKKAAASLRPFFTWLKQ